MSGIWASGTAGSGAGVNTSYTAAALEAARLAGTLTAGLLYSPSDITPRIIYWAETTSSLDPLGSQMAYSQLAAQTGVTLDNVAQTTVATITTLGYRYLEYQFKNTSANALANFDIAMRDASGADFIVTHASTSSAPTADFTSLGDGRLEACMTDQTSADPGALAAGGTVTFRLNVAGIQAIRIRAQVQTAAGTFSAWGTLTA